MRNALRLALGILVSLGCLYLATRDTDWSQVGATLASADPWWAAGSGLFGVLAVYVRAQRWRVLLRPLGPVGLYPALSATAIGFGASAILPFRVGEIVRPALLGRRAGFAMSAALSSIVLERMLDVLLIVTCFLAILFMYPLPEFERLRTGAYVLAALVPVALGVVVAAQRNPAPARRLGEWLLGLLPARMAAAGRPMVGAFLSGLGGLAGVRAIVLIAAYSVYLWSVIALTFLCALVALGIDVPLVPASLALVVIVAVCVFLPQAPGFVGTWQFGCVLALGLFHVPDAVGVGYSLLTWVVQMAVNLGTAAVFLGRENLSLRQLVRVAERDAATGAEG